MRIGVFPTMVGRQAGGAETYDLELVRALSRIDAGNQYTVYCASQAAISSFGTNSSSVRFQLLRPGTRWLSIPFGLPVELWRRPVDLLHATFVAPPFFPGRMVFTLLDLSPYSHPEYLPFSIRMRTRQLFASSIRRAEAVMCISEFTRQELLAFFPIAPEKTFVTHLGVDPRYRPMDATETQTTLEKYGVRYPYILVVGKIQARKNPERLLRAFHLLKQQRGITHKLLLVGRKTWTSSGFESAIQSLKLENDVVHTGHVPDEEVPYFYAGADVLAFVSLFEGFGLPILEAMACGTPVVTSRITSMPEIAGDAALLVDPFQVEEIADALHRAIVDSNLRSELRRKGLERVKLFTWEETARKTLEVYRLVQEGRN